jgi:hypothetical protein
MLKIWFLAVIKLTNRHIFRIDVIPFDLQILFKLRRIG